MDINLDELREAVKLMRELERIAEKIAPMLQAIEKNSGLVVPVSTERFITRGEVCEILNIGSKALYALIKNGDLTPLYIANSSQAKFRLSEVESIPTSTKCPKPYVGKPRGRTKKEQ